MLFTHGVQINKSKDFFFYIGFSAWCQKIQNSWNWNWKGKPFHTLPTAPIANPFCGHCKLVLAPTHTYIGKNLQPAFSNLASTIDPLESATSTILSYVSKDYWFQVSRIGFRKKKKKKILGLVSKEYVPIPFLNFILIIIVQLFMTLCITDHPVQSWADLLMGRFDGSHQPNFVQLGTSHILAQTIESQRKVWSKTNYFVKHFL